MQPKLVASINMITGHLLGSLKGKVWVDYLEEEFVQNNVFLQGFTLFSSLSTKPKKTKPHLLICSSKVLWPTSLFPIKENLKKDYDVERDETLASTYLLLLFTSTFFGGVDESRWEIIWRLARGNITLLVLKSIIV